MPPLPSGNIERSPRSEEIGIAFVFAYLLLSTWEGFRAEFAMGESVMTIPNSLRLLCGAAIVLGLSGCVGGGGGSMSGSTSGPATTPSPTPGPTVFQSQSRDAQVEISYPSNASAPVIVVTIEGNVWQGKPIQGVTQYGLHGYSAVNDPSDTTDKINISDLADAGARLLRKLLIGL